MAHNAGGSLRAGVDAEKFAKVWEYKSSPLYSEAERVAIDFVMAAASQPNDVSDALFDRMKQHWTEGQILEIVAMVGFFGFMNRYNDTMATPLESEPIGMAEQHAAPHGWKLGKHAPGG